MKYKFPVQPFFVVWLRYSRLLLGFTSMDNQTEQTLQFDFC